MNGILSMERIDPVIVSSDVFICINDQIELNYEEEGILMTRVLPHLVML